MTAREPSAVDVIAEALGWHDWDEQYRSCGCGKQFIEPGYDDHRAEVVLAALKAAGFVVATRDEIRAMRSITGDVHVVGPQRERFGPGKVQP